MDTAQWPQEIGLVRPMEDTAPSASTSSGSAAAAGGSSKPPAMSAERRIGRPQKEQVLNCPRCNSNNTKFCYYNNYSLTQPRYFCKTCRRYWTEGGSLRNVPVGGGSRKSKRSSSAAPASSAAASASSLSSTRRLMTPPPISISSSSTQNPKFSEGQDLNLGFHQPGLPPELDGFSNMELLRGGIPGRSGLIGGGFAPMSMPMPAPHEVYPSGFGLQDFRGFQLDGISTAGGSGGGGGEGHDGGEGRLLFPTGGAEMGQNRGQGGDGQGFWNGMMGGGGSW